MFCAYTFQWNNFVLNGEEEGMTFLHMNITVYIFISAINFYHNILNKSILFY